MEYCGIDAADYAVKGEDMKRIADFSFVLLILAVCLAAFAFAAAAETKGPQLFACLFTEGSAESLIYVKTDEELTKMSFTQKIGNNEYAPESPMPYSESSYSTSWIIVVESLNNYRGLENAVRALIARVADSMTGSDNMAVYNTYGDKYAFTADKQTIDTLVSDTMRRQVPGTEKKLYDAVYSAVETCKNDSKVNDRCSLVILSEFSDTGSSHSFDEVKDLTADFNGTIYMVGLAAQRLGVKQNFDSARVLADNNLSGEAYIMETAEDASGRSIADEILNNEECCHVLSTRLDVMSPVDGDDLPVIVTLQTGNMRIDSNTLYVDGAELNAVIPTEEAYGITPESAEGGETMQAEEPVQSDETVKSEEPVQDEETLQSGEPVQSEETVQAEEAAPGEETDQNIENTVEKNNTEKKDMIFYYIGGAAAAVLIAVIVFLNIQKRNKNTAEPDPNAGTSVSGSTNRVSPVSKITLTLTKTSTGEVFSGEIMDSSIKAGRDQKLLLTGDPGISGSHMEFIWQNGVMYVQDTRSLNGTYVNKKKITGAVPLQQNDMIHAGYSDFRVNWKSNS